MKRTAVAVALAAALGLLGPREVRADAAEDEVENARNLFREAAVAAETGDWPSARDKYAQSLALKRSALTLYNLAVSQKQCGALVAARDSLRDFLDEPQTEKSEVFRAGAEAEIQSLTQRIPRVSIVFESEPPKEVRVFIDDVAVAASRLDALQAIDPGRHAVRVDAPGHEPFARDIEVVESDVVSVRVPLKPVSAPKGAPIRLVPAAPEPAPEPRVGPIALMATGGAVALAGLSVGIAGFVMAKDPSIDAEGASSARSMGIAADVLMPTGVAAAGIGLVLFFVLPDEPPPGEARAYVRPSARGLTVTF